jgi:hypothetical protein
MDRHIWHTARKQYLYWHIFINFSITFCECFWYSLGLANSFVSPFLGRYCFLAWVTWTPLKTGGELGCYRRVNNSCSTSSTRHVNLGDKSWMRKGAGSAYDKCRRKTVVSPFFFWPLCCLFVFDLHILINPLVQTLLQTLLVCLILIIRRFIYRYHNEMSNLHRGHSIDASCHVSVNLAKQFQRRRFLKIDQSETRIA